MGEDVVAQEDALEEVENIDSSSDIDYEAECTNKMPPATEDVEITSTTSWSRTTTPYGNGDPFKKKKKVSRCCFLICRLCPSRVEADKAVSACHNKRTLPGPQADPNQWNSAYYGYNQGYEAYGYAPPPQDPNMYAYGAYVGYGNYQQL
ncbi:hypothetical protein Syun_001639 [Stephania yunnanensis]|uniref:Uncharacterized protein n=1 Tax=Stephania yunnanensis TaxID=152371 RepID=A0AAP0LI82_9MAGN